MAQKQTNQQPPLSSYGNSVGSSSNTVTINSINPTGTTTTTPYVTWGSTSTVMPSIRLEPTNDEDRLFEKLKGTNLEQNIDNVVIDYVDQTLSMNIYLYEGEGTHPQELFDSLSNYTLVCQEERYPINNITEASYHAETTQAPYLHITFSFA